MCPGILMANEGQGARCSELLATACPTTGLLRRPFMWPARGRLTRVLYWNTPLFIARLPCLHPEFSIGHTPYFLSVALPQCFVSRQ